MNRRSLLGSGAALAATGFAAPAQAAGLPSSGPLPSGPVTLYLEFRVAPPEHAAALAGSALSGPAGRSNRASCICPSSRWSGTRRW